MQYSTEIIMKTAIFFLLGLVAACSAGSISLLPAGATLLRSAAPSYYLAAPSAGYALAAAPAPASNLVLSRSALPALPSLPALSSYSYAPYSAVRSLLPSIYNGAYYY